MRASESGLSAEAPALARALAACRRHFVGVVLFSGLLNLLLLVPMLYMLQVYDRVVPTRGAATLGILTLILIYGLATLAILDFVRSRLLIRASMRLDRELAGDLLLGMVERREATLDALARQPMREFDQLRHALTGPAMLAVADLPWAPVFIVVAALIHPLLGLLILLGVAILAFITWRNGRAVGPLLDSANGAAARAYASQEEAVAQAPTLRALGMARNVVGRQLEARSAMLSAQASASFAAARYQSLSRFVRLLLQSIALGLGAWLAIADKISLGAIFVASYLAARALQPVDQIVATWPAIARARGAYEALRAFLAARGDAAVPTRLPDPVGRLEIDQLTVTADNGATVLDRLSFAVRPGDIVAVVGPSGAGKSTLLRTLAGALPAAAGTIRIDGAAADQWDRDQLARFIGYLPQEVSLLAGSIGENIARFAAAGDDPARLDAAVVAAAKAAGAHDLIVKLDGGYDRQLGWGGSGLSLGQAQRIGLARALFGDPPLVLLDEPNAHLDTHGELALAATIAELKARRATTLVVTHRHELLRLVDKILVLGSGRLELYGPRDEVLERLRSPAVVGLAERRKSRGGPK